MTCSHRHGQPDCGCEDRFLAKLKEVQAYAEAIRRIYDAVRAPVRDIVKTLVTLAPYTAGFAALHQLVTLFRR